MEKKIDSTSIRPDGERVLYAPLVEMNINRFVKQLKKEEAWLNGNHNTITIYKSESATIVLRGMHKKSIRKTSSASGDITIQVLKGRLIVKLEEKSIKLKKGQMLGIASNIPHSIMAKRNSFFLLTIVNDSSD